MIFWQLGTNEETNHLVVKDQAFVGASVLFGVNASKLRQLIAHQAKTPEFLSLDDDEMPLSPNTTTGDLAVWGAYYLFSTRAFELLVSLQTPKESFVAVNVDNRSRGYFAFLPTEALDGVDLERSEFVDFIHVPDKMPIPTSPRALQLIAPTVLNAPIFLVKTPNRDQVFRQPFCTTAIRDASEEKGPGSISTKQLNPPLDSIGSRANTRQRASSTKASRAATATGNSIRWAH